MWIDEFWEDLSEKPLLDQLNTFVKSLTDTKYTNILKPAMEKKVSFLYFKSSHLESNIHPNLKITPPVDERPANVTVPKPIIPKSLTKRYEAGPTGAKLAEKTHDVNNRGGLFAKKSADVSDLKFIDLDPTEIARQLTLVEFEMFSSLSVCSNCISYRSARVKIQTNPLPAPRIRRPSVDERRQEKTSPKYLPHDRMVQPRYPMAHIRDCQCEGFGQISVCDV